MSALSEKLTGLVDALSGKTMLPKSFRNSLKEYGDAKVTSVEINRAPIGKAAEYLMQLVTAGKWGEIRKNYDKIYHLYMCIVTDKGKLLLEKNEVPILYPGCPARGKDNESIIVPVPNIPLAQFVQSTIDNIGLERYTRYDGFKQNCQAFVKAHLSSNNLLTDDINKFVFQDTRELVENTPTFSQKLGNLITDVAGYAGRAWEELRYKKGGRVFGGPVACNKACYVFGR